MQVVDRLLCVIAFLMAVSGSAALYVYGQDSFRVQFWQASRVSWPRTCVCRGTRPGEAGFVLKGCPVRGGSI